MSSTSRPNKKFKSSSSSSAAQSSSHVDSATKAGASSFISQHHPEKPSGFTSNKLNGTDVTLARNWTLSIAIPSSIVLNAQTKELKGWLVGQIARTCAIFCVTEIVVYNDNIPASDSSSSAHGVSGTNAGGSGGVYKPRGKYRDPEAGATNDRNVEDEDDPSTFLARLLQYLETPQYLRKSLFPLHPSLRLAGLLPPLDLPHHLRRDDPSPFREGVIVETPSTKKGQDHILVDVGLWEPVYVDPKSLAGEIPEINTRVTIRMPQNVDDFAEIVPLSTPSSEKGLYWGYSVRVAPSLAHVYSSSFFPNGYDLSIGTSERGESVESILSSIPSFEHAILTLGPLAGLELVIAADKRIGLGAQDAGDLFDFWINVIEGQGSRTVRTEEALPIALARLKSSLEKMGKDGTVLDQR